MTVPYAPPVEEPNTGPYAAMIDAEAAAIEQVTENLVASVLALWGVFTAFWSGTAVAEFAAQVARLVILAQGHTGRITESYLRQVYRLLEEPLPPGRIVDLPRDLRLGADTEEVYQRPIRQIRYLMSVEDLPQEAAVSRATDRLEAVLREDVQNAQATAEQQVLYSVPETTIGWRRIIHPELGAVCGLCIAASDRVYQRIQKRQLHPGCKCSILPVTTSKDPGRSVNAEDLERLYAAAGSTTGQRVLSRVMVQFDEHGEIGPIILPSGATFKGVRKATDDLSDRAREQRRRSIEAQIAALESRTRNDWLEDRLETLRELLSAA